MTDTDKKMVTCPDCGGSGEVTIKQTDTEGGSEVISQKTVTCGACGGEGEVQVFDA